MIAVQAGEFVQARVPAYLERSLTLALGGIHAPFFTFHEGTTIVVILRRDEWDRLAPRFISADWTAGFRLISVRPPSGDDRFPERLAAALREAGVGARLLSSLHADHLLVSPEQLGRTLAVIRAMVGPGSAG